ncbi:uncharacterized protein I303_103593 [Kwoniella dejecticola CBS 10117]|uniref:ADF-H domain-containing protein n=1 Tax=Kwoniella dejecticola CBS 10117 TaxID=1296121 RepID=A0A1A6A765_9TREE|nr:uncharacterized protein I303_03615 [Kwoniella dejecticola CBS 10117]OBR85900.1 hypothetical protein I303_03615 [Kwoniella dejecticola CBS 10117]
MSAPSGIKVPPTLTSAFSSARNDAGDVRALVFTIEGESYTHLTTVKPKSTYKDDIALLPDTLPSTKTPASFAYRLDTKDGGSYEWMMITFVPDDAGVRAKMLQASSRSGLLKALGANNFKHDWFATSIKDLTPTALTAHLNHLASPPPLSASEAALAEVREAEAAEAKRAALDPETEARRRKVVVGLGGKMDWGAGVEDALKKVAKRSDEGWVVVLEIPATSTSSLSLVTSESATPAQLSSKIPTKSPSYVFYSYPTPPSAAPTVKAPAKLAEQRNTFQATAGGVRNVPMSNAPRAEDGEGEKDKVEAKEAGEGTDDAEETEKKQDEQPEQSPAEAAPVGDAGGKGRVIFVYVCPPSSPVKYRMIYSTSTRSVRQDAMDKADVDIVGKLETSDPNDLNDTQLKSALPPTKPTHSSSLPTPSSTSARTFGNATSTSSSTAQAAPFGAPIGGAFGRPRPLNVPARSATQIPLPASGPITPVEGADEGDSKDNIRRAFDAFGPRVNSPGGGGGGFARPRPAGRR